MHHYSLFKHIQGGKNGRHFEDIFEWIFLYGNVWISNNTSLKFVLKGPINNIPALVQIIAWRRPGAKALSGTNGGPFIDAYLRHSAWLN